MKKPGTDPALHTLTATAALKRIRAGELTAQALTQACLDRIEQLEPSVKAWVYLKPELAMEQAKAVDAALKQGKNPGPLAGIPVGIKDIFNTADMPTGMGSPLWAGYTPGNDARVVFSIRQAGGVILGKTVTAEFAVHSPGPTVNPRHPEHTPGTSSSGSAAAVAAGMVPLSLGSQTAGSTIRPASYCGIYGFKPSFGLIPRTGSLKTTDSLDTIGFFARNVEDLSLFLEATRVKGRNYPISKSRLRRPAGRKSGRRLWRIALVKGPQWAHAERYAQQALSEFASKLDRLEEIAIEEKELPSEMSEAHQVHEMIYDKALSYYFKQEFGKEQLISPIFKQMIRHGQQISLEEYLQAMNRQAELRQTLDRWFEEGPDAVLTLSTGGEAPKGLNAPDRPDNCLIWTLCGAPAVNLPAFISPAGLPFGAQLVARRYNDLPLLEMAERIAQSETAPEEEPVLEANR